MKNLNFQKLLNLILIILTIIASFLLLSVFFIYGYDKQFFGKENIQWQLPRNI